MTLGSNVETKHFENSLTVIIGYKYETIEESIASNIFEIQAEWRRDPHVISNIHHTTWRVYTLSAQKCTLSLTQYHSKLMLSGNPIRFTLSG